MTSLRFDGKVAVVTGAGGGLGRTYALMFAERGAAVVVNDLGGGRFGDGSASSKMADEVVSEIRRKGGKAVANYDSVEFGDRIVKTAIDNFGRIDILVNNAGILRDKSFINMTDADWDLIMKVHLKGAYAVTKAAWPYFRKQKYGRVIMTSSNAGIYGNFGQANYAAAKLGLVGFTQSLAREGAKYNIHTNALVPTAGSRLTLTVMPEEIVDRLKPEYVTPMVVYLCHESCTDNGGTFEAGGGWFGKLHYRRSDGAALNGLATTPEDVRDNWNEITNMNTAKHYQNMQESGATVFSSLEAVETKGSSKKRPATVGNEDVKPDLMKQHKMEPEFFEYTARDVIVYALGVGCENRSSELRYLYESHEDFAALPTFAVAPGLKANSLVGCPGFNLDLRRILHGEQYLELFKPLPTEGKLKSQGRISDVLDKGSGVFILVDVDTFDAATGEKVATQQFGTFQTKSGNFGGPRTSPHEKVSVPVPKRAPDAVIEQKTSTDQAALYRVGSGDLNPLHIDPMFAQIAGYKEPILHGLCTFGFSVRHILQRYADGDATKFKAVKVRFSKPVIPGQTLVTETWKDGSRIHFQTKVKETGNVVLSNCYLDLHGTSDERPAKQDATGSSLSSAVVFAEIKKRLGDEKEAIKKINGTFLYVITKNNKEAGKFTIDLKTEGGDVYEGDVKGGDKPSVTITVDDEDFVRLATGKLNPQQAFMGGKIKIKGNLMLLQKIQTLMGDRKMNAKL